MSTHKLSIIFIFGNVMTTKTIKTILFASLIAAMILPFSGMDFAEAEQEVDKKQRINDVSQKVKEAKIAHNIEKDNVIKIYKEYFSIKNSDKDVDKVRAKELKAQLKVLDEKGIKEYKIDKESHDKLLNAQKIIEASNLPFVSVGVDTKLKSVFIDFDTSLQSKSEKIKDQIESLIDTQYSVEFTTSTDHACTSQSAYCNPVIGGLKIITSTYCTLGFPVEKTDGTDGYITAGHCYVGKSVQTAKQGGYTIGTSTEEYNSGDCDCSFITKSTGRASAEEVFSGYNTSVSLPNKVNPTVGKWVVLTGAATVPLHGFQIGQVNAVGVTYNGITDTARVIGASAQGGDSGAPYYNLYDDEFFGIHKGGNTTYTYMIQWDNIADKLDLVS